MLPTPKYTDQYLIYRRNWKLRSNICVCMRVYVSVCVRTCTCACVYRQMHIYIHQKQQKWDNQIVIHIIVNSVFHECMKHIEVHCHFMGDQLKGGVTTPRDVPRKRQPYGILLKNNCDDWWRLEVTPSHMVVIDEKHTFYIVHGLFEFTHYQKHYFLINL